jgi:anti-sigma B factor antagonist
VGSDQGIPGSVRTGEIALERTDSGLTVLAIAGEHDLSTAPVLRQRLDGLIADGVPIVVDLSPATFVDSSILGVILDARRRAEAEGLGFAVSHANGADPVGRVLDITGLRTKLPVHGGREDAATAAISKSPGKSPA